MSDLIIKVFNNNDDLVAEVKHPHEQAARDHENGACNAQCPFCYEEAGRQDL